MGARHAPANYGSAQEAARIGLSVPQSGPLLSRRCRPACTVIVSLLSTKSTNLLLALFSWDAPNSGQVLLAGLTPVSEGQHLTLFRKSRSNVKQQSLAGRRRRDTFLGMKHTAKIAGFVEYIHYHLWLQNILYIHDHEYHFDPETYTFDRTKHTQNLRLCL